MSPLSHLVSLQGQTNSEAQMRQLCWLPILAGWKKGVEIFPPANHEGGKE